MNCPICGSVINQKIYHLCDNLKILGESFPEKDAFIVSCSECGLVYMDSEATQEDFLTYYKNIAIAPKYYDMFGKENTEDYYEHILNIIKPYITSENKFGDKRKQFEILDVAGAWGELAKYIGGGYKGYQNITVVDPNEACICAAKEKGLAACCCSSVDMADYLNLKYDLVILNHSLEHILDVKKTFENINALLKEDGYLFIEVPDGASYINEDSVPFNFLTYEHVLHLTTNDINNIAGIYGYEVILMDEYYKKVSNYPSIYAVLKKSGQTKPIQYSNVAKVNMARYLEKSKRFIDRFVAPLRVSGEPLVLWGIGASTAILLESFEGCNISCLIDSNPRRQGLTFYVADRPYTVVSPEIDKISTYHTIVILSIPYHASIEKQIREMGLNNKIVALA